DFPGASLRRRWHCIIASSGGLQFGACVPTACPVSRRWLTMPNSSTELPPPPSVKEAIRARALHEGFDVAGFARAEASIDARQNLLDFLARGLHGDMEWMQRTAERRADPKALWPEA